MLGKVIRRLAGASAIAVALFAVAVPAVSASLTVIRGSLTAGDTAQTGFWSFPGYPTSCNGHVAALGGLISPGVADVYAFWNATSQRQCVTATVTASPFCSIGVLGYSSYDPADIVSHVLGFGLAPPATRFSFLAAPFQTFQVVVSSSAAILCPGYTLSVQIGKSSLNP